MAAKLKILMFPWLGHAHVSPFLELSKNLSNKNFHIYFLSTAINLSFVRKNLDIPDSSDESVDFAIQLVELELPPSPELPPYYHTTKNIPPHLLPVLIGAFQNSSATFAGIIADLKPDLLVYDGFQPWSAKIAASLGIPAVFFSVSGSTSLAFFHHKFTHRTGAPFPYPAIRIKEFEQKSLSSQGESIEVKDTEEGFLFGVFELSKEIVLIKSCRAFEDKYMDHLSKLCHKKIVPTGPLITLSAGHGGKPKLPQLHVPANEDSELLKWLDQKSKRSTLYISFGTENYMTKGQIGEIAKGLELTNVNFIWVARSPAGSDVIIEEALPAGFLERTKERGKVVQTWVPQAAILAHANVGGYFTHCGWSSVTESVYFGVPVVALPLQSDHPLNARLVAEAGVGVEVARGEDGGFDGKGVAEAVDVVFGEERGGGIRRRAREMSEKMKIEENEAVNEVAKELSRVCLKK